MWENVFVPFYFSLFASNLYFHIFSSQKFQRVGKICIVSIYLTMDHLNNFSKQRDVAKNLNKKINQKNTHRRWRKWGNLSVCKSLYSCKRKTRESRFFLYKYRRCTSKVLLKNSDRPSWKSLKNLKFIIDSHVDSNISWIHIRNRQ